MKKAIAIAIIILTSLIYISISYAEDRKTELQTTIKYMKQQRQKLHDDAQMQINSYTYLINQAEKELKALESAKQPTKTQPKKKDKNEAVR